MKNKTRRISRILPAILAVMFCVTAFPVTAFAAVKFTVKGADNDMAVFRVEKNI